MKRMTKRQLTRATGRARRHGRVRQALAGTADCPRLSVFRSLREVSAQLIDDVSGKTLVAAGTKDRDTKVDVGTRTGKVADAYRVGYALAAKAKVAQITTIVFDRGGYRYHGRVAAVAEGARDGGLTF